MLMKALLRNRQTMEHNKKRHAKKATHSKKKGIILSNVPQKFPFSYYYFAQMNPFSPQCNNEDFLSYYCPFEKWKSSNNSNSNDEEKRDNKGGSDRFIRYSTTNPLDESFRNGNKPYVMYRHKFHPQGFHLFGPSKAGLEPLTAIRIMQSRLKDLAIKSQLTEREIKAQICNSAVILLENAEKDIEQLDKKRNDALIFGEEKMAKELSRRIRDKFDRVLFGTYADLLLEGEEVKAFGIESKWIGQSQQGKQNESGRRKSDSDWENLEEERNEERRRRRERRRGKRAKSAILGTMMRERYDISDLDGREWHQLKGKRKGKKGEKEENAEIKEEKKEEKKKEKGNKKEEEKDGSSSSDDEEGEDSQKDGQKEGQKNGQIYDQKNGQKDGQKDGQYKIGTIDNEKKATTTTKGKEDERIIGIGTTMGTKNGNEAAAAPLEIVHSDANASSLPLPMPSGLRRSLSAPSNPPSPNRRGGGILKDAAATANSMAVNNAAAFDSDSRLYFRRPSLLMAFGRGRGNGRAAARRRSSTVPPSVARERGKADLIVADAIQRLQRIQRRVQGIREPREGVENELEALDGVREAAKRFRQKRREKALEMGEKKEEEMKEELKGNGQEIEEEKPVGEPSTRKRVNFQIGEENLNEILPRTTPNGGKGLGPGMQWRRNSRTATTNLLHKGGPEWRRPNQQQWIPSNYAGEEEEEGAERLFPELVKTSANICPYCEQRDPWLENDDFLRLHLADRCPFLTRCEFCDKIVEVHELNDHHLKRCPFVGDTLIDCYLCGMARYPDEPGTHPKCQFAPPPQGGAWCPLCSDLIREADSKQNWLQHLTGKCYNNPRTKRWEKRVLCEKDRPTQMLDQLNETLASTSASSLPFRSNRVFQHHVAGWRQQQNSGGGILDGQFGLPPIGGVSSASRSSGGGGLPQIRALDVHHLRAAVRRLNHERRVKAIQRNVRISRRGPAEDSDSD